MQTFKQSVRAKKKSSIVKRFAPHSVLLCALLLLALSGALEPLNIALMDLRFRLIERAPSETLVVVEIDPYSLQKEGRWPWPRDRYATAISNLQDAGAGLIAFDVDFSSQSDKSGDDAFVEALERRPGEIILPVFSQQAGRKEDAGQLFKTTPNPKFLDNAIVASVNLTTEKNGQIRQGWHGFEDQDGYRQSVAATLASSPGTQDGSFYLDYSIDITQIPRLSFHDVLIGNFPKEAVAGKNIIFGASALELGDEFPAPLYGVTPGVVFHALGYETLLQERALQRLHYCIPPLLALLVIFWLCDKRKYRNYLKAGIYHSALLAAVISTPIALQYFTPVSFDVAPILAAQGLTIIYITGALLQRHTYQVIRQRTKAARSQALTNLVVGNNSDGVIITDATGKIELCNKRAKELLSLPDEADTDTNIFKLEGALLLQSAARDLGALPRFDVGEKHSTYCEHTVRSHDGKTLEIAANRYSSDGITNTQQQRKEHPDLFVYTLRDVSARKRIEEAERAAKDAAVEANKIKSQLISNMSHELRTPLNGVIGFADILQQEAFGPLGMPEYKEYSENIYTSGKRLLSLINDMLNIAKLDGGSFELSKEQMALEEAIEFCVGSFATRTAQDTKFIHTDISSDLPEVRIDLSVFTEIFFHILKNSVEFSEEEPQISIWAYKKQSELIIEIEDSGCGADPKDLPRLTDSFYQGDGSLNRQHEGAGLGLYVVSKFVALHGGVLELESEKGSGFLARLKFAGLIEDEHEHQSAA